MPDPRDWPGSWRAVRTDDGSWTLAHPEHGATCHSLAGAWTQARERYAGPCRVGELARERTPIALLDIGTGLGLNIAAACAALDGSGARLDVVGFERDTGVVERALQLRDWPDEVELHYGPVRTALESCVRSGAASSTVELGRIGTLTLHFGDARVRVAELDPRPAFDAVFLDPFAPGVEPELWGPEFLEQVALRMRADAILSTYSASLRVRRALARCGLGVGLGPRVGRKSAGTLASLAVALPPLDRRTVRRLAQARSEAELAKTCTGARSAPSIA